MRRLIALLAACACVAVLATTRSPSHRVERTSVGAGLKPAPSVSSVAGDSVTPAPTFDPDATTTTTTEPPPVTTTLAPRPQPAPVVTPSSGRCGDDFACFKACTLPIESGGDYTIIDRAGIHFGAFQFTLGTWRGAVERAGYPEWADRLPSDAPPEIQDAAARQLWGERGTQPWGGRCA